ncbi:MAG: 4Fe-4S binding protein [Thermincola sp.]|nr:4Fe-4S binding protein [Thermincola sp.]MDT3702057.1 4Fe-4S binding protein [Thermincola sp.]
MNVAYKTFFHEGEKGTWTVFPALCKGCGLCIEKCPRSAIEWSKELGFYGTPTVEADMDKCNACGICKTVCPDCAIAVTKK